MKEFISMNTLVSEIGGDNSFEKIDFSNCLKFNTNVTDIESYHPMTISLLRKNEKLEIIKRSFPKKISKILIFDLHFSFCK